MTYKMAQRKYLEEKIKNASPEELMFMTFEYTLTSLKKKDTNKARRGIRELIDAIDLEKGGNLATNLISLYEYTLNCVYKGELEEAYDIIKVLYDAFRESYNKMKQKGGKEDDRIH